MKDTSCGDIQGIYILHIFVHGVLVPRYMGCHVTVPVGFQLAFYSIEEVSEDFWGHSSGLFESRYIYAACFVYEVSVLWYISRVPV